MRKGWRTAARASRCSMSRSGLKRSNVRGGSGEVSSGEPWRDFGFVALMDEGSGRVAVEGSRLRVLGCPAGEELASRFLD